MKTPSITNPSTRSPFWRALFLIPLLFAFLVMPGTAHGQMFVSVNGPHPNQNGSGLIYQYDPTGSTGTPTIFLSNLDHPRGLVFDSAGNFLVATTTYDENTGYVPLRATIFKITPDGVMSTFATGFDTNLFLEGLVTDSDGDVFVSAQNVDFSASTIYKVTPNGTVSTFGSVPGQCFELALDSASPPNLFAPGTDSTLTYGSIYEFPPAPNATPTPFAGPDAFGSFSPPHAPVGLAFDRFGNLFVSTTDGGAGIANGEILEFPNNGGTLSNVPMTFFPGLTHSPRAIAFDSTGDLFLNENPGGGLGDILKFASGGPMSTFDSGIVSGGAPGNVGPEFIAFAPGPVTPVSSAVTVTFPPGAGFETTTVTVNPSPSPTPDPSKFQLGNPPVAYEITASPAPTTAPIIVAFSPVDPSQHVLHYEYDPLCGCNDWQDETIYPPNPAPNTVYASVNSLSPFLLAIARNGCHSATSISSNFNGTAISTGNYIWFNGVLKASGLGSTPVTIRFTGQTITSANFTLSVPDATVTFDPAATSATTTFNGSKWVTRVPSRGLAGNTFLSGVGYPVPINLPGGIRNVSWSGTVAIDTSGVSLNWKWAAAVYRSFSSNYTALAVKPVDDNNASQYQNSDHAGTPENFKSHVIGGATGGGGSNYTGAYGGTANVRPCP
jgi:sugar lactone lactonase YvrE